MDDFGSDFFKIGPFLFAAVFDVDLGVGIAEGDL